MRFISNLVDLSNEELRMGAEIRARVLKKSTSLPLARCGSGARVDAGVRMGFLGVWVVSG
jgi:hypothetical protein